MSRSHEEIEAFVHEHADELLTFAIHLTADRAQAQDLLQDSLIRLYLRWRKVEGEYRLSYVKKILVRENIVRWRRRRWRETADLESVPESLSGDFTVSVDRADALYLALHRLSARERTAISLRYIYDLPVSETSEMMQIPQNTVKTLCARALESLRNDPILYLEFPQESENARPST